MANIVSYAILIWNKYFGAVALERGNCTRREQKGNSMPNCLQIIRENKKNFTKSFKILADYVENHMAEIAFISIQELSSRSNVSTTTVYRFCQEIGFSGYADFQREIQNEVREKYNDESSRVDLKDANQSIFSMQCNNNIKVLQEICADEAQMTERLNRASELLLRARRVYVIGLEGDFASACTANYDFSKVLDNVTQLTMMGANYTDQIRSITSEDVLYVISFRIHNRHILDIINCFLKANASIITLADQTSPFNAFATVSLVPKHNTPSYGSVMKVTIARALLMTIIQMQRQDEPD